MLSQMKWLRIVLAALIVVTLVSGSVWAKKPVPPPDPEPELDPPFTYAVTWLGNPAGHLESFTYGMNDLGEVVGYSMIGPDVWADARAFGSYVKNGERVTVDLNDLVVDSPFSDEYVLMIARDINNSGQITGLAQVPDQIGTGTARAFRFTLETRLLEDLGTFDGQQTYAVGINDQGDVVGMWKDAAGNQCGFLHSDSLDLDGDGTPGGMADLGILPGYTDVWPEAMNNLGQVTGYVSNDSGYLAFVYTPPGLGLPSGMFPLIDGSAELTQAYGINDLGTVVGRGLVTIQINKNKTEIVDRAMVYDFLTGEIRDFADPPGCYNNTMYGINSNEEIVGLGGGFENFPYIYFNDTNMGWNLNELAGVELDVRTDEGMHINEHGQIGLTSRPYGGLAEPVLLTPVYPDPEP